MNTVMKPLMYQAKSSTQTQSFPDGTERPHYLHSGFVVPHLQCYEPPLFFCRVLFFPFYLIDSDYAGMMIVSIGVSLSLKYTS